jgi:GNAT superfamily N-acetyltransferase
LEFEFSNRIVDLGKEPNYTLDRSIGDPKLRDALIADQEVTTFKIYLIRVKKDPNDTSKESSLFYFRKIPGTDAIVADMIKVLEKDRNKGVSHALFRAAFQKLPDVRRIVFYLDETNKEIFDKNLTGGTREDLIRAYKTTPAYKSYSKLGFTEIDHISLVPVSAPHASMKVFPHVILRKP